MTARLSRMGQDIVRISTVSFFFGFVFSIKYWNAVEGLNIMAKETTTARVFNKNQCVSVQSLVIREGPSVTAISDHYRKITGRYASLSAFS